MGWSQTLFPTVSFMDYLCPIIRVASLGLTLPQLQTNIAKH